MKRPTRSEWLLLWLLAGPSSAIAADDVVSQNTAPESAMPQHRLLTDTFRISLGGFYSQSTTEARLSTSTGGAGVGVNFEDLLGLSSDKWVGEGSLYWRFAERWRLEVDYFRINRSASRALESDVIWGDNTYPAGTTVDSRFDMTDIRAAAGYSFFRRPDKELGLGFGVHTIAFKASLDAAGVGAKSESVTAPLPFVSVFGNFALTDTWAVSLRADWLSLSTGKYSGRVRSTAIDFFYQPYSHFAFGFGLHSLSLRLDVDKSDSTLQTRILSQGPSAFLSYSY